MDPDRSWYLDLLEVHGFPDELVVFRQLLAGRELDENLTQLPPAAAAGGKTGVGEVAPGTGGGGGTGSGTIGTAALPPPPKDPVSPHSPEPAPVRASRLSAGVNPGPDFGGHLPLPVPGTGPTRRLCIPRSLVPR